MLPSTALISAKRRAHLPIRCSCWRRIRATAKRSRAFSALAGAGGGILTVRFTYRGETIRIIGAGYWRKGKKIYEEKNG